MTIVLPMTLDGAYEVDSNRLKAPDDLAHLFAGELLTEASGAAIAEWVKGGRPVDHAFELFRREAFEAASSGTECFTKWWNRAPVKTRRNLLRRDLDNLASVARAANADAEREREAHEETRRRAADAETLDNPFGGRLAPNHGATSREPARLR